MKDFFKFNKFITPSILSLLFIVWVAFLAFGFLISVLTAFSNGFFFGLMTLIGGGISFALLLVFTRVAFEMMLVIFSINDKLQVLVEDTYRD